MTQFPIAVGDLVTPAGFLNRCPQLIETIGPLASAESSVSFANIPLSFRALMIEATVSATGTENRNLRLRVNGDSGASDYRQYLRYETGAGTVTRVTGASDGVRIARVTAAASGLAPFTVHLPNYRGLGGVRISMHASGGSQNGTAAADMVVFQSVGWRDSGAAATSIQLEVVGASIAAGSVFFLYGLP